ncbi:MFS transporter, partial [Rhizobium rhizoryzae]
AQLLTIMGIGNMVFQIPFGMISDRLKDRRPMLFLMALAGLLGALALPYLIHHWWLMAGLLLVWGGCVSGLYTVGLAHLGSRLTGSDLAAANAAFVFSYAVGTVAGPQAVGVSIDLAGNNGFAWALAGFFALYVVIFIVRTVFSRQRT